MQIVLSPSWKSSRFISPPKSEWMCAKCNSVPRQPCRGDCPHTLCKECIFMSHLNREAFSNSTLTTFTDDNVEVAAGAKCPVCFKTLGTLAVPLDVREFLGQMMICDNNGCSEVIKVGEYVDHISSCPHSVFKCPYPGCGALGSRTEMKQHLRQEQVKRLVTMPACKERLDQVRTETSGRGNEPGTAKDLEAQLQQTLARREARDREATIPKPFLPVAIPLPLNLTRECRSKPEGILCDSISRFARAISTQHIARAFGRLHFSVELLTQSQPDLKIGFTTTTHVDRFLFEDHINQIFAYVHTNVSSCTFGWCPCVMGRMLVDKPVAFRAKGSILTVKLDPAVGVSFNIDGAPVCSLLYPIEDKVEWRPFVWGLKPGESVKISRLP